MSNTLANTAVRVAMMILTRDRTAVSQCLRVKNLLAQEVIQFVAAWADAVLQAGLEGVKLVVADNLGGAIDDCFAAEPGRSITHYRNNNRNGLVYLETSVQSDEQGLQNMFSLRDSNYLDCSFDDHATAHKGIAGLLIEQAWSGQGGTGRVPEPLMDRLIDILRLVHPGIETVPVRRFVGFVEIAARSWIDHNTTIDEHEADRIVGGSLWSMDMFADEKWREGDSPARRRRRLELNARHADLLDGGIELEGKDIAEKARTTRFVNESGEALPAAQREHWRKLCADYGLGPNAGLRKQIPYSIFSQLFVRDTTGLKLGDRVRSELDRDAPSRVAELDGLDVVSGLNAKNNQEAARLLDAPAPDGEKHLADILSAVTRKSVERLAILPRRRFFNPSLEIVRVVQRVRAELTEKEVFRLRVRLGSDAVAGSPSHGLFVFLFGPTLRAIAENQVDVPGACEIEFDDRLLTTVPVPCLQGAEDEGEDDPTEISWKPLPLRFEVLDAASKSIEVMDQMEWHADDIEHFALIWILAAAPESSYFDAAGALSVTLPADGSDWRSPFVRRETTLEDLVFDAVHMRAGESPLLDRLSTLRLDLRSGLRDDGMNVPALRIYLDQWLVVLEQAREQFVPDGVRSRELESFLGCDMVAIQGTERRLMLALHPIRLRWICGYLNATRQLAETSLAGNLTFADGEGERYLDWLESRTPRESPPVAIGHNGHILYSRSEVAWCEDFSPLSEDTSDVSFDSSALSSVAQRVASYLDAHPYKRDGLSLLIVLPTSDQIPAELIRRLVVKSNKGLRISLHVAAPRSRWEAIARHIEQVTGEVDGAPRQRLFPDRDLAFVDFQAGADMDDLLGSAQIDIAIVTHVLRDQIVSQQNTDVPLERPGAFDPLMHRPMRLETGGGGASISLVMLPKYPDRVLESWSTLAVRANRSRAVSPGQPENTDFVELRINFQDSARLFKDLHEHCHWVITLERHITREQIESAEAGAPDILSIEDGVGANGLGTLVVSSRSGRKLIESRIARKLSRLVPADQLSDDVDLAALSTRIYDSTRLLSPRLALQALGVARVTEEIVGLTVARRLAEEHIPAQAGEGLVAWISLDEHTDWFGGHDKIRADMCRISILRDETGQVVIDILVLEGKLRQLYDGHGVAQVSRTCAFFQSVLSDLDTAGTLKIDGGMWRELIASAIEYVADEAVTIVTPHPADNTAAQNFKFDLLSDFRSGEARLRDVAGIYSACLWESVEKSLKTTEDGDVTVICSTRAHLLDLVRRSRAVSVTDIPKEEPLAAVRQPPASNRAMDQEISTRAMSEQVHAAGLPGRELMPPLIKGGSETSNPMLARTGPASPATPVSAHAGPEGHRKLAEVQLRRMYECVLGCFDTHHIAVVAASQEEAPWIEGPASILFRVRPGAGVDPKKLVEKASALKLVLELEQEQNVSFNIDRGFVTIDVPKRPEQRYFVDAAQTWLRWRRPENGLAVPIGEDRFGEPVVLNFSSANSPHLLVAGTTGSGKSEALNTILFGMVRHYTDRQLRLLLVDPKGTELAPFAGSSHLQAPIGWDEADALVLLEMAVSEMQRRYVLFKAASRRSLAEYNAMAELDKRLPWWVIVLDEYADLTHDPQAKKDIETGLKRLAQKARAAGIHVIIATQKPSAEVISTNLRSNLPAQLALRVKSATESRVVIDEAGAENLNGKGDGLLKSDGKLQRVQCSRVDAHSQGVALGGPRP